MKPLIRSLLGLAMLSVLGTLTSAQVAGETGPRRGETIAPDAYKGAQPPTHAGSPDAAVIIESFTDFSCPQCAVKNPVFIEIRAIYGNRIDFVFRHFPLDIAGHEKSYDAAIAAEAAGVQGKFWDMQNLLLFNQKVWRDSPNYRQIWKGYARRLRLDISKWEDDCAGIPARFRVDADIKRARSIGVNSVPTLFISGVEFPFEKMSVDELKEAIDAELAKSKQAAKSH